MSDFVDKLEELSQKYFGHKFKDSNPYAADLIILVCKNIISDDEAQELIKYVNGSD